MAPTLLHGVSDPRLAVVFCCTGSSIFLAAVQLDAGLMTSGGTLFLHTVLQCRPPSQLMGPSLLAATHHDPAPFQEVPSHCMAPLAVLDTRSTHMQVRPLVLRGEGSIPVGYP